MPLGLNLFWYENEYLLLLILCNRIYYLCMYSKELIHLNLKEEEGGNGQQKEEAGEIKKESSSSAIQSSIDA